MQSERVEVRLDSETRGKLEQVAAARGTSVSELVRSLIEDSYQEEISERRLAASRQLGELGIEDVPDPGELKQQFAEAHGESR
jgi:predicted transcriptional regulator